MHSSLGNSMRCILSEREDTSDMSVFTTPTRKISDHTSGQQSDGKAAYEELYRYIKDNFVVTAVGVLITKCLPNDGEAELKHFKTFLAKATEGTLVMPDELLKKNIHYWPSKLYCQAMEYWERKAT